MFYYAISSGEYSDYGISGFFMSEEYLEDARFKEMWLDAVKRASDFNDTQMGKIATYLKLDINNFANKRDVFNNIGHEKYQETLKAVNYEWKSNLDFYSEILSENGLKEISYQEHNIENF